MPNFFAKHSALTFSIEKGQLISFVGESGSGKSTFLKCLSGLENINSGKVILNDKIINDNNLFVKPQKRKIGYVFQDYTLFPDISDPWKTQAYQREYMF